MNPPDAVAAFAAADGLPRDPDGPVFAEPWQAQAFALADAQKLASTTISPGLISASTPANWRGAKTCAAPAPERDLMHVAASPSAIRLHVVGRILAAALPQRRTSSSRLIGNPPENAVAGAVGSESSAFVC